VMWAKPGESASDRSSPAVQNIPSDEDFMLGVQAHDQTALGALFDRYSRIVRGIGYQVLRDRGEAEELVQDVFLYVHEKAALFDRTRGSVKTWIIQVAYHKGLDRRTYLARRRFYDGTNLEEIEDNVRGTTDIEQELGLKFSGEQLRKAFDELSERQRMTLELFFFQGLSLREIGQQLDEPLANVRHHYYRALKRLKKSAAMRGLWKV
jgi:RNA polymerase sigma-70 factor (ECF subfamily)